MLPFVQILMVRNDALGHVEALHQDLTISEAGLGGRDLPACLPRRGFPYDPLGTQKILL